MNILKMIWKYKKKILAEKKEEEKNLNKKLSKVTKDEQINYDVLKKITQKYQEQMMAGAEYQYKYNQLIDMVKTGANRKTLMKTIVKSELEMKVREREERVRRQQGTIAIPQQSKHLIGRISHSIPVKPQSAKRKSAKPRSAIQLSELKSQVRVREKTGATEGVS